MGEKYVFIDRDGVVNRDGETITEHGYITKWEEWEFLPGVLDAFALLAGEGYKSVIISNQKCIAKGIMTREELDALTERFLEEIEKRGGKVEKVYYCPHRDEDECDCRKPKEGLFLKAREELGIKDLNGYYFIGDSERDMAAGKKAGLDTILVLSGKSSEEDAEKWSNKPDHVFEGLLDAAKFIVGER